MGRMFRELQKKINSSVILKTVLKVTLIFTLALALITVVTLQMFFSRMEDRIISDQQVIVEKISNSVNYPLDSLTAPMITLANNNSAVSLLNNQENLYSADWLRNIRSVAQYLTNVNLFSNYIMDVALIRPDSTVVYSMSKVLNRDYDYCGQKWFQDALKTESIIKFALPHGRDHYYSHGGSDYAVTAIYPAMQGTTLIGYILMEVDITRISDIFTDQTTGTDTGFLLIDDAGRVIYDYLHKTREQETLCKSINLFLEQPKHALNDQHKLYIGQRLPSTGWYVLSETDYRVITKPALDIVRMVFVLVLLSAVAVFFMVRQITRSTRRPINALILRISSYDGSGSIALDHTEAYTGEFLTVRTKFEEMADKISSLINDVYLAQMHQREMEFKALMNQINPHFLYNVLQLIQTKAVLAGNREIEDMITSLGSMLRYTMDRSHEQVTVREELDYIEHYLTFYKARFEQLFTYDITCEEELCKQRIPKFLLQPLVENCFKHGFQNLKQNGVIQITATRHKGDFLFGIRDNGQGISPERLDYLRRVLESNLPAESIGVANTHARIRLVYGAPYGIAVESDPGNTCITVRLKMNHIPFDGSQDKGETNV